MPTLHTLRAVIVCPVGAKLTGVVNWLTANIDPQTDPALGPPLSATGIAPATHRWCNWAMTDIEARAMLFRCCDLASVTKPSMATWNGWNRSAKLAWLVSVHDAMLSGFGIGVWLSDNEGTWATPASVLAAMGLKRVELPPG